MRRLMKAPHRLSGSAFAISAVVAIAACSYSPSPENGKQKCGPVGGKQCPSGYTCYAPLDACFRDGTLPDGGFAGQSGTGGASGSSGTSGAAGATAGTGGGAGTSGIAGSSGTGGTPTGKAGSGGASGAAGTAGSGGAAGTIGAAGTGGMCMPCTLDTSLLDQCCL
jgi:hypothetical protein